jgi:glyoxylase-like metal-dependent hydrolase (beta-lactamase superfamily II)
MPERIAERWFERRKIDDDITLLTEPYADPLVRCNIWHVRGRERDLLVDSGLGLVSLKAAARDLFEKPVLAFATHSHMDHVGSLGEFETRIIHRLEAHILPRPESWIALHADGFPESVRRQLAEIGYPISGALITALPYAGFDARRYRTPACEATRLVEEGDVVELGDRVFEVLHLPGHSPGSAALWEHGSGILFAGDALYDGPLLDEIPGADVASYIRTTERLRALPVRVVHAGHEPSFGRERLIELVDGYLERRAPQRLRALRRAPA